MIRLLKLVRMRYEIAGTGHEKTLRTHTHSQCAVRDVGHNGFGEQLFLLSIIGITNYQWQCLVHYVFGQLSATISCFAYYVRGKFVASTAPKEIG
jgi:hypothetical protein